MRVTHGQVKNKLHELKDPKQAQNLQRFFKTGKGDYGEGDIFLGIKVPLQRKVAREFLSLSVSEVEKLLKSPIHEHRLTALLIWTYQFPHVDEDIQKKIYSSYMRNTKYINNWDLVDVTAPQIVGAYLLPRSRESLYTFARSKNLWKKRIAIISTFTFIRDKDFNDSLKIAHILLGDTHDLIHKAVGWMLREVGNRNRKLEMEFLNQYAASMSRTMLRYAIEKFPKPLQYMYLKRR
ncbi:MAG: DNA alkylation repair protein [Patescibacteria group bacterium]|jgi:3-methyladenine DNA glycosylase AlkD